MSKKRTLNEYRQVKTYGYESAKESEPLNEATAEDFLNECDYISQEDGTVYIDEQALIDCMEAYALSKIK
jgi:hypothetical protein|tara:strand:- start:134 stop:343 length:210 start_codon:yes stop_codon:yes gene_type:complete